MENGFKYIYPKIKNKYIFKYRYSKLDLKANFETNS